MTDTSIATPNRRRRSAASQLLIGLLIIVVGLLFTLENLGVRARDAIPALLAGRADRDRAGQAVGLA